MINLSFDDVAQKVLEDERAKKIPVLFVIQIIIIMDDLGLI